jgi:hypothetical protein
LQNVPQELFNAGSLSLFHINFAASDVAQKVQQLVSKVIMGSRNAQMTVDSVLAFQIGEFFAKNRRTNTERRIASRELVEHRYPKY